MYQKEHLPSKNYEGVDMISLFTSFLFEETWSNILIDNPTIVDSNLDLQSQEIVDVWHKIRKELKKNGKYFYPDGGSIYNDYKIAKRRIYPKDGLLTTWRKKNIHSDMSAQEIFVSCKQLVETWWK